MGRSLVARWPIVPASEVPDDLVDQAMAVLQGKSREAVIRELQRTVSCGGLWQCSVPKCTLVSES